MITDSIKYLQINLCKRSNHKIYFDYSRFIDNVIGNQSHSAQINTSTEKWENTTPNKLVVNRRFPYGDI